MYENFDDDLYELSDEDLLAKVKEAKAEEKSPDTQIEEDMNNDAVDDTEVDSTDDEEFEVDETTEESEETDEELESDLEQPVEDSDHDGEDDTTEEEESDDSESEEGKPDGDTDESDEEKTEDDSDEEVKDSQPVEKYKFKANGREYEFTEEEMKANYGKIFGQAMDYTKKMQVIKPWRKTIDALEQANLSHDDVNLAIDVLKGDKNAIAEVMKRKGIDALDLDLENGNYVANDYGRDESTLAVKDVLEDISNDPEYATTANILGKQWDESSWNTMTKDPQMIKDLHIDVKNGMFDKIAPRADKIKMMDGGTRSDLEYYIAAAQEYNREITQEEQRNMLLEQQRQQQAADKSAEIAKQKAAEKAKKDKLAEVKAQEEARNTAQKASQKRKAAAPTKSRVDSKPGVIDYLNADDEEYEEWYRKLQNQ